MRFTKVHVNALVVIILLAVVAGGVLLTEAWHGVIGCALGEILLTIVIGMVWCAKSFSAQPENGGLPDANGDPEE